MTPSWDTGGCFKVEKVFALERPLLMLIKMYMMFGGCGGEFSLV